MAGGRQAGFVLLIFLDCVEQEEQTLVDLIERLRHLR